MASSSKTINMPLMFAITIGSTVSLLAITMFGLAWYEFESKTVIREQVLEKPTHDKDYDQALADQQANLAGIDEAIKQVADANAPKDAGQATAGGTDE